MVSKRLSREAGHRRKFLAIIDETPECERAVAYASKRAAYWRRAGTSFVIDPTEFQAFLGVEKVMREEATANAKSALDAAAARIRTDLGIEPEPFAKARLRTRFTN
jgi:hypothetical protein